MMPLHLRLILALVILAAPLGAQTAADSGHAKPVRAAVDTIRRTYPGTLKNAPTLRRLVNRVDSLELAKLTPPKPARPIPRWIVVQPPPVIRPRRSTRPRASSPLRAELPRSVPNPSFAKATRGACHGTITGGSTGRAQRYSPGGQLILSGTFTGNFTLPHARVRRRASTSRERTSRRGASRRRTAAPLAKIVTTNSAPRSRPRSRRAAGGSSASRSRRPSTAGEANASTTGASGSATADGPAVARRSSSLAQVPQQLVLDRVYVHGDAMTNCDALPQAGFRQHHHPRLVARRLSRVRLATARRSSAATGPARS
jgi:hypothetical protein